MFPVGRDPGLINPVALVRGVDLALLVQDDESAGPSRPPPSSRLGLAGLDVEIYVLFNGVRRPCSRVFEAADGSGVFSSHALQSPGESIPIGLISTYLL